MEINKSGGGSLPIEVNFNEPDEDSKIEISFRIPDVEVRGDGQSTSSRESGCPNDDVNETNPIINPNFNLNSEPLIFKGAYFKGDPEKISGSETINFLPPFKNDFMTMTHTVQVNCTLYKLRR